MSNITEVAKEFFEACETGKGWEACRSYCTPDASFSAQAEPLAGLRTLREYTDWMRGLLSSFPALRDDTAKCRFSTVRAARKKLVTY